MPTYLADKLIISTFAERKAHRKGAIRDCGHSSLVL